MPVSTMSSAHTKDSSIAKCTCRPALIRPLDITFIPGFLATRTNKRQSDGQNSVKFMQIVQLPVFGRPVPDYRPPTEPLTIIFQDDDVLVLDKPSGLLSVPGKQPGAEDCLQSRAIAHHSGAEITHRLDWDTSGLLVMALNPEARRNLGRQFEVRSVEKHYVARVWGTPAVNEGKVDLPLRCDWPNRPRQLIDHDQGKSALTYWRLQSSNATTSTLLLKPKSGRTHQLRVHCASMGHPILGDRLYAHEAAYHASPHMYLHATYLELDHPMSGSRMTFESACPF